LTAGHGFVPETVIVLHWPAATGFGVTLTLITVEGGGVPTVTPTAADVVTAPRSSVATAVSA
jgi:hypothetical protein